MGCPIRIWMKDICERTGYEVKRAAEDRKR